MATSTRKPVVVVTGASRGIGLAITRILLQKFNVRVVALSRTISDQLLVDLQVTSDDLLVLPCDVSDEHDLTTTLVNAERKLGHIDGLILNAGILDPLGFVGDKQTPVSEWKRHFDVNFFSSVSALKTTLPALRRSEFGGKVVFVSSGAAVKGMPTWGAYSAGKAALNSLCRTVAAEESNIVAVAVRPGMVDTDMQAQLRENPGSVVPDNVVQTFVQVHKEGKLVKPEDAGHVIAALSLQADEQLSGQFLSWDSEEFSPYRANQGS